MKIKLKTRKVCSKTLDNSKPMFGWFIHLLSLMNIGWITIMPKDGLNQDWMVNLHRTHSLKQSSPVGGWLGPLLGNVYCWDLAHMINSCRGQEMYQGHLIKKNHCSSVLLVAYSIDTWGELVRDLRKKRRRFFVAIQYYLWIHWHDPVTPARALFLMRLRVARNTCLILHYRDRQSMVIFKIFHQRG